jgi:outer membrane receptor protein involved in Fe transport
LTGGNEDTYSLGTAIGGPISDSINGRVSWHHYKNNGYRNNSFLGQDDTNERDETTVRGKLRWQIGDAWEVLASGLYADFDNGYDAWTVRNDDISWSNNPGKDRQETTAGSLKVTGPLGSLKFVSISSIASSDILFSYDGDWGNADFWQGYGNYEYDYFYRNPRDRDTLSQEFRIVSTPDSRLFNGTTDWVAGTSWQQLQEDNQIDSTGIYADVGEEDFCVPFCATDRSIDSNYKADNLAVFGSIDATLTERWGLSLGLRVEHWDARYSDVWNDINYSGPPDSRTCNVTGIDCTPDEDMWGGHVALSYAWSPDLRGYARIARGFKAGGFNPSLAALQGDGAALGEEFLSYEPEYLLNYELGLKGAWLDGALSGDLVGFYMDRDDAQLSQSSQQVPFDPNSFVFVSYNGQADVYGLEATGAWQIFDALQLHGSLGWLRSNINSTAKTEQVSPDAINRDLAHAPRYTVNFGASYRDSGGWFGRVDIDAVDDFYFDISHNQKSESYQTVSARVGKEWEHYSVSVWGKNIFDEDYATRGFYFGNEPGDFIPTLYTRFGDPRSYGITLKYSY